MKSQKVAQNSILRDLAAVFPHGIIMRLKELSPEEEIIEAAFLHIHTADEVERFYREYTFYCHLRDPKSKQSEESMVMKDVFDFMLCRMHKFLPLWVDNGLAKQVKKVLSYN